jgi:hypothetical protein
MEVRQIPCFSEFPERASISDAAILERFSGTDPELHERSHVAADMAL